MTPTIVRCGGRRGDEVNRGRGVSGPETDPERDGACRQPAALRPAAAAPAGRPEAARPDQPARPAQRGRRPVQPAGAQPHSLVDGAPAAAAAEAARLGRDGGRPLDHDDAHPAPRPAPPAPAGLARRPRRQFLPRLVRHARRTIGRGRRRPLRLRPRAGEATPAALPRRSRMPPGLPARTYPRRPGGAAHPPSRQGRGTLPPFRRGDSLVPPEQRRGLAPRPDRHLPAHAGLAATIPGRPDALRLGLPARVGPPGVPRRRRLARRSPRPADARRRRGELPPPHRLVPPGRRRRGGPARRQRHRPFPLPFRPDGGGAEHRARPGAGGNPPLLPRPAQRRLRRRPRRPRRLPRPGTL